MSQRLSQWEGKKVMEQVQWPSSCELVRQRAASKVCLFDTSNVKSPSIPFAAQILAGIRTRVAEFDVPTFPLLRHEYGKNYTK
uniref:Uncharacterized protein n=1 Tax=Talaromyces marneffei PM1 TaxID=1077442 RepID=A0A093UZE5_TALMA